MLKSEEFLKPIKEDIYLLGFNKVYVANIRWGEGNKQVFLKIKSN